ncbi:hypothetical protein FHS56_000887 [Thermonema lapsum]|uniref:Secretion system C-terminal sorting domain-containing protein n=2 Tax=Thermonema lapsum TaxID=28195 RepID=A0A846MPP2_9BACT|nr:hypothetical protein [Thermonema lapsum]
MEYDSLDLQALPQGVYFLRVVGTNQVHSIRIVKQ